MVPPPRSVSLFSTALLCDFSFSLTLGKLALAWDIPLVNIKMLLSKLLRNHANRHLGRRWTQISQRLLNISGDSAFLGHLLRTGRYVRYDTSDLCEGFSLCIPSHLHPSWWVCGPVTPCLHPAEWASCPSDFWLVMVSERCQQEIGGWERERDLGTSPNPSTAPPHFLWAPGGNW